MDQTDAKSGCVQDGERVKGDNGLGAHVLKVSMKFGLTCRPERMDPGRICPKALSVWRLVRLVDRVAAARCEIVQQDVLHQV